MVIITRLMAARLGVQAQLAPGRLLFVHRGDGTLQHIEQTGNLAVEMSSAAEYVPVVSTREVCSWS